MTRPEEWQKVLQAELVRWSSMTSEDVLDRLWTRSNYEVSVEGKVYQVEAVLLENTPDYLHVSISVDDGSLLASLHPVSESFICRKSEHRVSAAPDR